MSLLFAAALAASTATVPTCSWDRPGANPYMGNVVTAVDRYDDIPETVRSTLKKRIAERRYDEVAVIRRDAIVGKQRYSPEIRDMHFGQGQVCRTVTRTKWTPANEERGLVYCESGHCIIVPTVCRNVSRVTRLPPERTASAAIENPLADAGGGAGRGGADSIAVTLVTSAPMARSTASGTEAVELQFDAPGAGPSFAQQADPSQPGQLVSTLPLPAADSSGTPMGGSVTDVDRNPSGGANAGAGEAPGGLTAGPAAGGSTASDPWPPGSETAATRPGGSVGPFGPGVPALSTPVPVTVVPESGTWVLWPLGLAALAGIARRRRRIRS